MWPFPAETELDITMQNRVHFDIGCNYKENVCLRVFWDIEGSSTSCRSMDKEIEQLETLKSLSQGQTYLVVSQYGIVNTMLLICLHAGSGQSVIR